MDHIRGRGRTDPSQEIQVVCPFLGQPQDPSEHTGTQFLLLGRLGPDNGSCRARTWLQRRAPSDAEEPDRESGHRFAYIRRGLGIRFLGLNVHKYADIFTAVDEPGADTRHSGEPRLNLPLGQFLTVRVELLLANVVQVLQLFLSGEAVDPKTGDCFIRPRELRLQGWE